VLQPRDLDFAEFTHSATSDACVASGRASRTSDHVNVPCTRTVIVRRVSSRGWGFAFIEKARIIGIQKSNRDCFTMMRRCVDALESEDRAIGLDRKTGSDLISNVCCRVAVTSSSSRKIVRSERLPSPRSPMCLPGLTYHSQGISPLV
jgi:hypothetical protein